MKKEDSDNAELDGDRVTETKCMNSESYNIAMSPTSMCICQLDKITIV